MEMILVWHLVCSLEPLQRGTLPPEQRERVTVGKGNVSVPKMRIPEMLIWLLTKEMLSTYVSFSVDG